jgi:hypothetical protein
MMPAYCCSEIEGTLDVSFTYYSTYIGVTGIAIGVKKYRWTRYPAQFRGDYYFKAIDVGRSEQGG